MALPSIVRIASLCSGGGGLDLGVARALARLGRAHRGVVYVEREAYAAAVLASRIAEGALATAPIWSDLVSFDGKQLRGAVDLFIAGVPCQGNSVAGKRLGRADDRWLWPHVERILDAARPAWFFLENVRGLLSVDGGAAFADILGSLARLGFDAEWCVLRASDIGAPHRRERVFLLAYAQRSGLARRENVGDHGGAQLASLERGGRVDMADAKCTGFESRGSAHDHIRGDASGDDAHRCDEDVADAIRDQLRHEPGRGGGTHRQGAPVSRDDGARWPPGPDDADGWRDYLAEYPDLAPATESPLRRGANGLAARLVNSRADQLRLLGNGVVPEQAAAAFIHLYERITNG